METLSVLISGKIISVHQWKTLSVEISGKHQCISVETLSVLISGKYQCISVEKISVYISGNIISGNQWKIFVERVFSLIFTEIKKNMQNGVYLYEEECSQIIGACYEVHNSLGHGFLEPVYHEALSIVFDEIGIPYESEKQLEIWFHNRKLQKVYYADFMCFGSIILELKACEGLASNHIAQVLNYLKATNYKLGLLINFGTQKVQIKRVIL